MNLFVKVWNKLSFIGLKPPVDFIAQRRVILCNQLCLLTLIDTLLYELLFAGVGSLMLMLIHSFSIFIYLLVLWLNKKRYFSLAKHFLLFTVGIEIFVVTLLLGTNTGIHIYFFPLICAVLILFDYTELRKALLIVFVYLLLAVTLYIPFGQHTLQISIPISFERLLFISTLTTSLLLTILCVFHLVKANNQVEEDLRQALYAQGDLNQELLIREEELKINLDQLSLVSGEVISEKAKLSAIVENFNHFICCIDKEYRLIYCNTNYQNIFSKRFGKQLQAGDRILDYFTPDVTERWKGLYDRALAGEKFMKEVQGQSLMHEAYFSPIVEENNKITGITIFMQDISARKAAEREIIAAKELAEQATQTKSEFLSNMSHELRTPMNAVIGLTHLLIEQNPRPEQLELLQVLRFSSENLLSIINDILDLQKIEAGKIVFEKTDFDLKELLHNLMYSMQLKAQEKKLELVYEMDSGLPYLLKGDSLRLTQILNNLLSNAVKFTETGSVKLQIKLLQRDQQECRLYFAVTDTGIGIAKDKLQLIFNPFEQAETNITRKYGGTGLGLSITKKLIELQTGTLQIESQVGVGTTFYFSLPYGLASSSPAKAVVASTRRRDLSHIRLLLVEDNTVNMMVATKFLQKWNIAADHASDGKEALDKVQQKTYDLVLMDLQMPVMNGFEACRAIRNLGGAFDHLPVVALTADVSGDVQQKVLEAGMNSYLSKPFVEEKLYATLINFTTPTVALPATICGPVLTHKEIARQHTKSFNLEQVILLASGDKQFLLEILLACRSNLAELQADFARIMLSRNIDALRSMKHKLKTSVMLFELYHLQSLLEQSAHLLQQSHTSEEELQRISIQLNNECLLVKQGLEQYMGNPDNFTHPLVVSGEIN